MQLVKKSNGISKEGTLATCRVTLGLGYILLVLLKTLSLYFGNIADNLPAGKIFHILSEVDHKTIMSLKIKKKIKSSVHCSLTINMCETNRQYE